MTGEAGLVPSRRRQGATTTIAGWLTVGAGLASLLNGGQGLFFGGEIAFGPDPGFSTYALCGVICILSGVVALAGGIAALKGRHFSLALTGGLLGMMGGGLVGFWLGLAALVLYSLSDVDF